MALAPGIRLGPYEIGAQIGAGGMGEVYRARDTKLQRDVAIKVLPETLARDSERLARFQREAKTLAALNHPNVAQIHGLQESDDTCALVMELVEGPTLGERIAQGPMPVTEALAVARQIVEALDAAHQKGIVHRDLKPANIKVRSDGVVKVLDFGLAVVVNEAGDGRSQAPTMTFAGTRAGVVFGTAAYMSPEQARGQAVDRRTDVWAFACVLYEMLAGRPAFPGGNAPEIFAAILEREPDWRSLPDGTPQPIVDLLITSLQKDQKARVRDMSAVREAIADAVTRAPGLRRGSSRFGPARAAAAMVGAAVIVVGALAVRPFLTRETGVAQTPASSSSIAVLPFVNVTGVEDNEYLADGLAQELTSLLAKQTGLRVVSRTSAFAFKGRNLDVREIARQLNVGSIVEGTLHQAGNRLRVAVQLTDATNGFQLWSETFEHDAADVLAVDREISRAIVGRLIPPSQVVTGSAMPPTTDGEAYDLFLRGQYAMAQRSKEGLTEAEGHFREAVRRDPEFGAAWAGLAETIIPLHEIYQVRKQDEAYALVTDFVRRALTARAPALSEGHAAFAHVLVHQYRWRVAVEEASLAIAANPGSAIGHEWLGYALLARGRLREAEEALRRAIDLDPLTGVYSYLLAVCLLSDGRAEEALRAAERGVQLGSSISIMPGVLARVQLGRPEEARALVNNAPKGTPWHILEGLRIYTLAASGDRTEARRQLPTHLQRLQGGDEPLPMVMPFVYVALGEPDKAVDWLRRSPDAGEFLVEYRLMPEIRDLAANPTMQEVMRQLDFSEP